VLSLAILPSNQSLLRLAHENRETSFRDFCFRLWT
jgi:hypothetical protein